MGARGRLGKRSRRSALSRVQDGAGPKRWKPGHGAAAGSPRPVAPDLVAQGERVARLQRGVQRAGLGLVRCVGYPQQARPAVRTAEHAAPQPAGPPAAGLTAIRAPAPTREGQRGPAGSLGQALAAGLHRLARAGGAARREAGGGQATPHAGQQLQHKVHRGRAAEAGCRGSWPATAPWRLKPVQRTGRSAPASGRGRRPPPAAQRPSTVNQGVVSPGGLGHGGSFALLNGHKTTGATGCGQPILRDPFPAACPRPTGWRQDGGADETHRRAGPAGPGTTDDALAAAAGASPPPTAPMTCGPGPTWPKPRATGCWPMQGWRAPAGHGPR